MIRLPVHPGAAYFVASIADKAGTARSLCDEPLEPIDFTSYWQALDRIPQTSIRELAAAENDATLQAIILDRAYRLRELRWRWLLTPPNAR